MQRLEMCVDRRLRAGMVERAVDVMMTSEVVRLRSGYQGQLVFRVRASLVLGAGCICPRWRFLAGKCS